MNEKSFDSPSNLRSDSLSPHHMPVERWARDMMKQFT